MTDTTRRRFLRASSMALGSAIASSIVVSRFALAAGDPRSNKRFVFVMLRGALDGLSAVPPIGDPDYARLRGELALGKPGTDGGALPLDGTFGLHPALAFMHSRWQVRELSVIHAVATPYRERSHFDGQDVLENGLTRPHATQSGWLNRALGALPRAESNGVAGVALGANIPLVMRGPTEVASWSPSRLAALDDDTLQRIVDLYARDPLLSQRLADALATEAVAESGGAGAAMSGSERQALRRRDGAALADVAKAAANFLVKDDGPRVAVLETTGWDTHANEGGAKGLLALRLTQLDAGLQALQTALGSVWRHTAILLATEFGRTAAANGTRGTDHGTGAAAFLLGGAVLGGRVIADWPSLRSAALYQGRDLEPTLDLRAVCKGLLAAHLAVSPGALETEVFPDSSSARAIRDLVS